MFTKPSNEAHPFTASESFLISRIVVFWNIHALFLFNQPSGEAQSFLLQQPTRWALCVSSSTNDAISHICLRYHHTFWSAASSLSGIFRLINYALFFSNKRCDELMAFRRQQMAWSAACAYFFGTLSDQPHRRFRVAEGSYMYKTPSPPLILYCVLAN